MTDARAAARRWARTWQRGWEERDVEAVLTLYAPNCEYWTEPFREPYRGLDGARKYVTQAFAAEHTVTAWFGDPLVDGNRAAVPWWATQIENDEPVTLAGISLLVFDADGLVVEEWDAWNQADSMRPRPLAWERLTRRFPNPGLSRAAAAYRVAHAAFAAARRHRTPPYHSPS